MSCLDEELELTHYFCILILSEFTTYGTDVLAMTEVPEELCEDSKARVFLKMTKCIFHKFGHFGKYLSQGTV